MHLHLWWNFVFQMDIDNKEGWQMYCREEMVLLMVNNNALRNLSVLRI